MGGLVLRCSGPNLSEFAGVVAVLVLGLPCFFAASSLVPSSLSLLLCNLTLSFLAATPLQFHCPIVCLCFSAAPSVRSRPHAQLQARSHYLLLPFVQIPISCSAPCFSAALFPPRPVPSPFHDFKAVPAPMPAACSTNTAHFVISKHLRRAQRILSTLSSASIARFVSSYHTRRRRAQRILFIVCTASIARFVRR